MLVLPLCQLFFLYVFRGLQISKEYVKISFSFYISVHFHVQGVNFLHKTRKIVLKSIKVKGLKYEFYKAIQVFKAKKIC